MLLLLLLPDRLRGRGRLLGLAGALLLLGGPFGYAQAAAPPSPPAPPPDSLRARLRRPGLPDTARVRAYWQLARYEKNIQLDSARRLAEKGVALARRIGDAPGEAYGQHGLAVIQYLNADYPAAQRTYVAALRAATRAGLCPLIGRAYMGQGLVADATGNVAGAVAYFEQARAVFAGCTPPDSAMELVVVTNIGNTYLQAGQLAKAERPLRLAQTLVRPSTGPDPRLNLLDLIGLLQLGQHHPDSAVRTWQQELRLARAAHQPRAEAYALGNLASARLQQNQPAAALPYVQQAIRLARTLGNRSQLTDYSLVQARILHALGHPAAFDSLMAYAVLHDTLVGQARNEAIVQQQVRFDVANQQARIRALRQQQRISRLQATEQAERAQRYALVAGGLLVVVAGGGALIGLLTRSRRRLQTSETALRQANDTQQELMRIIGHDLRGPVATFQQITPLLHGVLGPMPAADDTELVRELDASAQHLGALVDNLLHWARVQGGLVKSDPVRLRAATAVQSVVSLYEPVARHKRLTLTPDAPPDLGLTADLDLLTTVLRNLLGNAIKFTPAGGTVQVAATGGPGGVTFSVTDSGVGMSADALAVVFGSGGGAPVTSQSGTAGEPGTGLGLPLCRRFVALLGGELRAVPNAAGSGMRFWFVLPSGPGAGRLGS